MCICRRWLTNMSTTNDPLGTYKCQTWSILCAHVCVYIVYIYIYIYTYYYCYHYYYYCYHYYYYCYSYCYYFLWTWFLYIIYIYIYIHTRNRRVLVVVAQPATEAFPVTRNTENCRNVGMLRVSIWSPWLHFSKREIYWRNLRWTPLNFWPTVGGLEHDLWIFPSSMGCHPSHWRTHMFQDD